MSRSRNLKPGFFRNPELSEMSPLTRLFFQGLWCEADRRGIVEDRPKKLKADILPYDKANPEEMLKNLESSGFIQRYEVDGIRCIFITKFSVHQNPHRDEKVNTLPAPCEHRADTVQGQGKTGTSPEDSLNTDSLNRIEDCEKPVPPTLPASNSGEHPQASSPNSANLVPTRTISDKWDLKIELFEAYCAGVGIKPGSAEMERRRHTGYADVEQSIGLISAEKMRMLAAWVLADWQAAGITKTPSIGKVIEAEAEYDRVTQNPQMSRIRNGTNGQRPTTPSALDFAARALELERQGL